MEMNQSQMDKIQKELEEQTKLLKSMRNSMRVGAALSVLKVLLIVVPLILALIYLPSLFQQYSQAFTGDYINAENISLPGGFDFSQFQQYFERNQ